MNLAVLKVLDEATECVVGFGTKRQSRDRFVGLVELCCYEHQMREQVSNRLRCCCSSRRCSVMPAT